MEHLEKKGLRPRATLEGGTHKKNKKNDVPKEVPATVRPTRRRGESKTEDSGKGRS